MLAGLSLLPYYVLGMDRVEGLRLQRLAESRASVCQQLAVATSLHMRRQDQASVRQQLEHFCQHTPQALSARIVRFDGQVVASLGDHESAWHLTPGVASDINNIRITIRRDGRDWGNLEAAFGTEGNHWSALAHGMLMMLAASSVNFIAFFLVLKRTLKVLDPSNSVPRRVKNTLDTIAGGVVVLDGQQRIVLANEAFSKYFFRTPVELVGGSLDEFAWRADRPKALPWHRAIELNEQCSGKRYRWSRLTN